MVLLVLLFAGKAFSQTSYHELSVSYGILSSYELAGKGLINDFLSEEMDGKTEKSNHGNFHLSLIGVRYGQKFGAFTELELSFKGLINFGVNVKL